ncbi:F0F1 ATP synthase subunit A [Patescibacteria group bacterium]
MGLNISLSPEVIFNLGSFPVTNAFFVSIFVTVLVLAVFLITKVKFKTVPGRFQALMEVLIEGSFDFVESVIGDREKARRIFPLAFTMFVFILISNLLTYIPGQAAITLATEEGTVPLFRAVMADYGMVFVMTMVTVILVQIIAIVVHGPFGYLGKFFNFKSPLGFFLGLMDIIGEIAKIVSLSFRLFGNIFAGEVLGAVMLSLAPFFIPLPFMFLGLLTAVVQAFVFAVLTLVFVMLASTIEEDELVEEASI